MSGYLQGWLENREISIAVTFNTPSSESIVSRRILREDIMLIGRCKDLEELPSPYPWRNSISCHSSSLPHAMACAATWRTIWLPSAAS